MNITYGDRRKCFLVPDQVESMTVIHADQSLKTAKVDLVMRSGHVFQHVYMTFTEQQRLSSFLDYTSFTPIPAPPGYQLIGYDPEEDFAKVEPVIAWLVPAYPYDLLTYSGVANRCSSLSMQLGYGNCALIFPNGIVTDGEGYFYANAAEYIWKIHELYQESLRSQD